MGIENKILNSHLLTDIFGYFPGFHDAEVLQMTLNRGESNSFNPNLEAIIHVFEMTSQINEQNKYVLENHTAVTLCFMDIHQLSLENFNYQNVLQELKIIDVTENLPEEGEFEVSFDGVFGVDANFLCNSISVESVKPFIRE